MSTAPAEQLQESTSYSLIKAYEGSLGHFAKRDYYSGFVMATKPLTNRYGWVEVQVNLNGVNILSASEYLFAECTSAFIPSGSTWDDGYQYDNDTDQTDLAKTWYNAPGDDFAVNWFLSSVARPVVNHFDSLKLFSSTKRHVHMGRSLDILCKAWHSS